MPCPPIHWKHFRGDDLPLYASFDKVNTFAVVGECVGHLAGLYSVKICRKGHADLWGYAGSVEQAKRHVERWARSHWRTVGQD